MKCKLIFAGNRREMEDELNAWLDNVYSKSVDVQQVDDGYLATVLYEEVEE